MSLTKRLNYAAFGFIWCVVGTQVVIIGASMIKKGVGR